MGAGRKTKTGKYEDAIEEMEMGTFKRVQMTKKELRQLKEQREAEIEDKLENLDDDFKAIESIVKRSQAKVTDTGDHDRPDATKFAKSLKKIQKTKFSDLKSTAIEGDHVYKGQKDRLRDKKVVRKE